MAEQPTPVLTLRPKTSLKIDRRAWVRFPKNKRVGCHSASAPDNEGLDTAWLGKVRDISRSGIALSLRQRFEPGTALTVELSDSPKVLVAILAGPCCSCYRGMERSLDYGLHL